MKRVGLAAALVVLLAGGAAVGLALGFLSVPASASADEVVVEIPKGSGLRRIAEQLARERLVTSALGFRLYARAKGAQGSLRAGEFRLRRNMTPPELLEWLLHGERVLHKITVPEGFSAREIADAVEASGLARGADFRRLAEDAAFARSLGIPADRLEGYLLPDTYHFEKGIDAGGIATAMVRRFQTLFTAELQAKATARGLTPHQAVTLASIVEKETATPAERPVVAGVFYNRLGRRMRLESDPTIIYGMRDYAGDIRKKDIHDPTNVYNTYVIDGLPPGPIANPGIEALRAVAEPATHEWLFFVAHGSEEGHVFAKTYAEHRRNVARYLERRRALRGGRR